MRRPCLPASHLQRQRGPLIAPHACCGVGRQYRPGQRCIPEQPALNRHLHTSALPLQPVCVCGQGAHAFSGLTCVHLSGTSESTGAPAMTATLLVTKPPPLPSTQQHSHTFDRFCAGCEAAAWRLTVAVMQPTTFGVDSARPPAWLPHGRTHSQGGAWKPSLALSLRTHTAFVQQLTQAVTSRDQVGRRLDCMASGIPLRSAGS